MAATDSDIDAEDLVLPEPIRANGKVQGLVFRFLIPRAQPIHPLEQGNKLRGIPNSCGLENYHERRLVE